MDHLKYKNVEITIERIGRGKAQQYLDTMRENRSLKNNALDAMVRDMINEEYDFDGAPIRFDSEGRMIDGQHRMSALVQACVTLPFLVVRGLSPEKMLGLDRGVQRTIADQFKLMGISNYVIRAAATNMLWKYLNTSMYFTSPSPTVHEAVDLIEEHADFKTMLVPTRIMGIASGTALMLRYIVEDKDLFDRFWSEVHQADGRGPAMTLAKTIMPKLRASKAGTMLSPVARTAALMISWNAYATGSPLSKLHIIGRNGMVRRVNPAQCWLEPEKDELEDK